MNCLEVSSALQAEFPVETDPQWHQSRGAKLLPLSGRFLRTCAPRDLIAHLRAVLPTDARLNMLDGLALRMRSSIAGHGSDVYVSMFTSKEWPLVEEGAWLPELAPVFYSDARLPDHSGGDHPPYTHVHVLYSPLRDQHEFVIDKRAYKLEIPRDRETEERLVIILHPISEEA